MVKGDKAGSYKKATNFGFIPDWLDRQYTELNMYNTTPRTAANVYNKIYIAKNIKSLIVWIIFAMISALGPNIMGLRVYGFYGSKPDFWHFCWNSAKPYYKQIHACIDFVSWKITIFTMTCKNIKLVPGHQQPPCFLECSMVWHKSRITYYDITPMITTSNGSQPYYYWRHWLQMTTSKTSSDDKPTNYWLVRSYGYCQTSNISNILEGNKIVDHSDVVGTSQAVSAAPTTSSFST